MDDLTDRHVEELTAELAWIRRLALSLVRDPDIADDVSQDTWLAASRGVRDDRPLKPWLSRVVLNVVRMRSRGDGRRGAREAAIVVEDAPPSPADLVDRVEMQRALTDAVLGLAEPYRTTVLLHFYEGLTSAEIARRLGIPDGTVRRRLKVALDDLRAQFTQRERDRKSLLALAPLTLGEITMKKQSIGIIAVLFLLLAIGGGLIWKKRKDDRATSQQTPTTASAGRTSAIRVGDAPPGAPSVALEQAPWFTQKKVPGRRIAGRVTLEGKPMPGATVRLGSMTGDGGGRVAEELASVRTNPDGAFDFGVQTAATFVVSAEASDTTPASIVIATANPRTKTESIVLDLGTCRARLHGTIVDASGGGIAKARLSIAGGLGGSDASASGQYSLCVPMGDSRVRIVADGYGALDLPIHLVGALQRDFELVPEAVLAGNVVDEAGNAVPFARVMAIPQAVEQPHFLAEGSTIANRDGKFRIPNLAPGRFLVAAAAQGHGMSAPKPAIAAHDAHGELTLVLGERAQVSGVVMMKGAPVAGARVSTAGVGLMTARAAYSQTDGSFVLDGVPFGTSRIVAGEFDVVSPRDLVVDKAVVENVMIEVTERSALFGKVTRKGKPVPDALIQTQIGPSTRTDSTGTYELRGLPPGDIGLYAQSFGEVMAFAPFQTVKVAPQKRTEHDIELTGAGEVSGTVVDESGNPVPNVYVRLIEPKGDIGESMTDARGRFRCTSMLGGADYRAAVFPSPGARTAFPPAGGGYPAFTVTDGDTVIEDIKIAIKHERLAISGRAVDEAGEVIADVHVEAIGRGFGGNDAMLPSVRAAADGSFTIDNLARGTYTLHAHAGDGSEVEVTDIAAGTKGVTLRLVRPGSIEGTIVGFSQTPRVAAHQVTAELRIGNEAVVEGNRFTITGLTPGKYTVEAHGRQESAGQSVIVKAGAVAKVTLESKGRGSVQGRVTELGTNTPVRGMQCVAAQSMDGQSGDAGGPNPNNKTDATGAFTIPAPIGKVRVMCFSSDNSFSVAGGDTEVTADKPGTIELRAVRAVPPPSDVGFRIKPMTLPLVIATVDAGGPAKAGGLAVGDIVTSIDGQSVAGLLPGGAMMLAWNHRPGTTVTVGVERNGAPHSIKIVAQAPAN